MGEWFMGYLFVKKLLRRVGVKVGRLKGSNVN